MHNNSPVADFNTLRGCVQVGTLIQIHPVSQPDVVGKPQTDLIFNGSRPIHVKNKTV
jgi:hypothetical protein